MSRLSKNIYLMYGAHIVKMLLPLFLFPIVARSISAEEFGLFVYYQGVTMVSSCIVEFGFAFTAVNAIATAGCESSVQNIVSRVEKSKFLLTIFIITLAIAYASFTKDWLLLLSVISGCISGMTANYYYQGKEKFSKITKAELIGMVAYYSISIFFMLNGFEFYWLIISYLSSRVIVYFLLSEQVKLIDWCFDFKNTVLHLKENSIFFLHRSTFVIYSTMSIFLVGNILGEKELAMYSGAEKIVFVACGLIQPFQQVLLPYLSRNSISLKLKKAMVIMFIFTIVTAGISPFLSEKVFYMYYGNSLYESYKNFNILIWLFPLKYINSMIMVIFFLSKNKARPFSNIYTKLVFVSLISSYICVIHFGVNGMMFNLIAFELILILISMIKVKYEKV